MPSANIVPDFTLSNVQTQQPSPAKLSTAAQQVLHGLAQHDGQQCTICHHVIRRGEDHTHNEAAHQSAHVRKPIPVSDRMHEACQYEDGPTIRPSQSPALALATVMKGLEIELAQLKSQLGAYQQLYNSIDSSLNKRQRKYTGKKIEALLRAIDAKSDQIYGLYDVLEGQKAAGQEMSGRDAEVTLQSLGIELSLL